MEQVDLVIINKADGDLLPSARKTKVSGQNICIYVFSFANKLLFYFPFEENK